MLVLTRKLQQGLVVGGDVVIKVLGVKAGQVRLGIEAPKEVKVHRSEVYEQQTADFSVSVDDVETETDAIELQAVGQGSHGR